MTDVDAQSGEEETTADAAPETLFGSLLNHPCESGFRGVPGAWSALVGLG